MGLGCTVGDFRELVLGLFGGVDVWVEFLGEFSVGFSDLPGGGLWVDAQEVVVFAVDAGGEVEEGEEGEEESPAGVGYPHL